MDECRPLSRTRTVASNGGIAAVSKGCHSTLTCVATRAQVRCDATRRRRAANRRYTMYSKRYLLSWACRQTRRRRALRRTYACMAIVYSTGAHNSLGFWPLSILPTAEDTVVFHFRLRGEMQVDAQSWVALAAGGCAAAYVAYCYGYINAAAERTAAERKPLPRLGLSSEKLHYEFANRTSSLEEDAVESDERPGTPSTNDAVERPDTPTTVNGRRLWCAWKPPSHAHVASLQQTVAWQLAPHLSHGITAAAPAVAVAAAADTVSGQIART